jgi:hypothetical protein
VRDQALDDGSDQLTSGPERSSARRSPWVLRVAGLLAVGVVAVTAGPGLLSSPDAGQPHPADSPAPAASEVPMRGPNDPHNNPLRGWASRGPDLGTPFVTAALARMRVEGRHVSRVLWAGSLDGKDHVVVVSYLMAPVQRAADDLEVGALVVHRESQLATAHSVTIGYVGQPEGLVAMAVHGDDDHTRLLVLSYPAPRKVQVSTVVDYHPDGDITRRWRDGSLAGGVLVTDLGRAVDPTLVVRPKDLSSQTDPILVDVQGLPVAPRAGELAISGARSPSYAGPAVGVLVDTLGDALRSYADLRNADVRVVWSGRVVVGRKPSGQPARMRAALLVVRRRDGATFQVFVSARSGDLRGDSTVHPVRWSDADRLPYALNMPGYFLLISPGGPGSATLRPTVGPRRITVRLDGNGVGTVHSQYPDGAGVVVRDPAGRTTLRATLVNGITADIFGFGL